MQETAEQKKKRFNIAKELFEELSRNPGNPEEVQTELKEKIKLCEDKKDVVEEASKFPVELTMEQLRTRPIQVERESQLGEKPSLELSLSEGMLTLKIDEKLIELELKLQQDNLLKELIRNKEIHWLKGLMLFPEWRDESDRTPPNQKFAVAMRRLNEEIEKLVGIRIVNVPKYGTGLYKLMPNVGIMAKNIEEAKKLCKEARKAVEKKDYAVALRKTEKAVSLDSKSGAYSLLIDTYCCSKQIISHGLLGKAEEFFLKEKKVLDETLVYLDEKMKPPVYRIWKNQKVEDFQNWIVGEIERLRKQLERTRDLMKDIRPDLNQEEKFWVEVADKIDTLRKNEFASELEKERLWEVLLSDLRRVFERVAAMVSNIPWMEEDMVTLVRTIESVFCEFVKLSTEDYPHSSELETYLIPLLRGKVLEVLGTDETLKRVSDTVDVETAEKFAARKKLSRAIPEKDLEDNSE